MEYTTLGNTGMEISRICLGGSGLSMTDPRGWALKEKESKELVNKAIDLGVNFFDTANNYSGGESEKVLGEALEGYKDQSVIATKVHPYNSPGGGKPNLSGGYNRKSLQQEINNSLERLQMSTVDLYQLHFLWDKNTTVENTLRNLSELVAQNKTRFIGASSCMTHDFAEGIYKSDMLGLERFLTMQNHYNLVYREEEREKLPFCEKENIGIIPYSPLARGYLARPHEQAVSTNRSEKDPLFHKRKKTYEKNGGKEINRRVQEVATDHGATMAQISIAWLLENEWVDAPIIGATKVQHLKEAVEAIEINLSKSEVAYLEEPYEPKPIMGPKQVGCSEWKNLHNLAPPREEQIDRK